jgi:hypothetical protein
MEWAIILCVVGIGVHLLLRQGVKPIYYRRMTSADFRRFIEGLISQGGDGALLFIRHEGSERFVQFAKYLSPRRSVHFGFPDAPWSRDHFTAVEAAMSTAGFLCHLRDTQDGGPVTRFLCIDDLSSAKEAGEVALVAFRAMGLGPEESYEIHQEGPVSLKEWKRYVAAWKSAR